MILHFIFLYKTKSYFNTNDKIAVKKLSIEANKVSLAIDLFIFQYWISSNAPTNSVNKLVVILEKFKICIADNSIIYRKSITNYR